MNMKRKISHGLTRMTQIKSRPETFIGFLTFLSVLIRVNLWQTFFPSFYGVVVLAS